MIWNHISSSNCCAECPVDPDRVPIDLCSLDLELKLENKWLACLVDIIFFFLRNFGQDLFQIVNTPMMDETFTMDLTVILFHCSDKTHKLAAASNQKWCSLHAILYLGGDLQNVVRIFRKINF